LNKENDMPSAPITQEILLTQGYALNAATEANFRPATPTRIHRLAYVASTSNDADAVLTLALEQADGTAASPTGAALDTVTITTALSAVNLLTYYDFQSSYGDLIIYPGEQLSVVSDAGGTTGVGDLWLTVEPLGFANVDVRSHAIAGAHPGSTDLATALANATELSA
jgi:hypothetical protein